ncbi:GNAT family N-acetyltransferase/peptidase C39 family protein [Aestuariibacter sp. A3R04]|uniref:GNAT family N-acetyltransferase/peptidase C39 family protein n=1 Tax=Aestuariibacter sp. A3R04 TaxID=2841571 RepID=UPI001C09AB7D|nr:peptidase C39 family protein [Aestuariibacter sp. A3R04]MBU3022472.1 peptidase C39 family protein [Aestuariibacter sp. A3R04]
MNITAIAPVVADGIVVRTALPSDLDVLWEIEQSCFSLDRLSRRRLRFYLSASHAECVVAQQGEQVYGYALLLLRRGTLLTRLYSIAVLPDARGKGVAAALIGELESRALLRGKRFMRLEVSEGNKGAIKVYDKLGFSRFGVYTDYYEDQSDAIRMQKVLNHRTVTAQTEAYPWYQQTTEFTCGPASLMMAMSQLDDNYTPSQEQELTLWRQATTIFMTSGHGGCHPIGLALAAKKTGYNSEVWLNKPLPLFTDGVRSAHKKAIVEVVENSFLSDALEQGVDVHISEWKMESLEQVLKEGAAVLCLISTYAFDKKKAPHWVTVTASDERCLYFHDPYPDKIDEQAVEFQHIPVARDDFIRLASYGKRKLRAAVIVRRNK